MLKRTFSALLAAMLFCGSFSGAGAAISFAPDKSEIRVIDCSDYGYETVSSYTGHAKRYIVDANGKRVNLTSDCAAESAQDIPLPSRFDLRDSDRVTGVKDQGNAGTCWAFGTLNACESNLITKGLADGGIDLSEDHLTWFTGKRGWLTGDGINFKGGNDDYNGAYHSGGYWINPVATLISWSGAAPESRYPYSPYNLKANGNYSERERFVSEYHLQDVNLLANDSETSCERNEVIKQSITDNGAVTVSFCYDESCFNDTTGAYYQNTVTEELSSHEISIVGWDDDYPVSSFKTGGMPPYKGAWLCKNSWSTESGEDGYLWLSYYDKSICEIASFSMEQPDNYDTVYFYDGYMLWLDNLAFEGVKTNSAANVFTASGFESLEAVGFYTMQEDVGYTVRVFTDVSDDNPESGTDRGVLASGTFGYAGYHTVKLDDTVSLSYGQKYSVVVTLTANSADAEAVFLPFEGDTWFWSNFSSAVYYSSNKGESFVYYPEESCWLDGYNTAVRYNRSFMRLNNAGIKAYTSYTEDSTSPSAVAFQTKSRTANYKDSFQITNVTVTPDTATNKGLQWGTSDIFVASVDNSGNVYARGKGTATIYVEIVDGGRYDTCTVKVKYSLWQWLIIIFLFGWLWY